MISFFAKPPFFMKHLQRVSSTVRGEQIAAYMGNARLNPPSGYENDICIYVKPHIKHNYDFKFEKNSYVDIHESIDLVNVLKKYPKVKVIVLGDLDAKTVAKHIKNEIIIIPHHHLNFERLERDKDRGILRVGTTGSRGAFDQIPQVIRDGLAERKIELLEWDTFYPRTYVAKFHHSLDIHIHWRDWAKRKLSVPFKIINAASFGIPTIGRNEPSFYEVEGCYIGVDSPEEWLEALDKLIADKKLYSKMAKTCLETAEKYHIDNIAKLYEKLT